VYFAKNVAFIISLLILLGSVFSDRLLRLYVVIVERIKDTRAPFYRPPLSAKECEGVHPGILMLMKQCWAEEPNERPSFVEVAKSLKIINKGKLVCYRFFLVMVV